MVDAGSTGTRLYVYTFSLSPSNNLVVSPALTPSGSQFVIKTSPGISDVPPTLDGVSSHLGPLVQQAAAFVPAEKHAETNIYVKATGGMRLLPNATVMVEAVRTYLGDPTRSPFRFKERNQVAIISGEHEGLYAWLAINYMLGHFDDPSQIASAVALDLGGASTQIAFEPAEIPIGHHYSVRVNNVRHEIYTHSYLRFGVNEARKRLYKLQVESASTKVVEDPCGWRGHTFSLETEDGTMVEVKGTGRFEECLQVIQDRLLGLDTFCPAEPCGLNGIYQAPIPPTSRIYAVSSFAYTASFFNCSGPSTLTCLLSSASSLCDTLPWSDAPPRFPTTPRAFLPGYCFGAAYAAQLVNKGFGVDLEREIVFRNEDGRGRE
ncbi:hypothetical protein HK104_009893, partial [Borealophlyctis nickersoniae]